LGIGKNRPSSGAQSETRKQYNSLNNRVKKQKDGLAGKPQDGFNLLPLSLYQKNKLTTYVLFLV